MIRYIKHDEIDFKRWDNCIKNSVNSYVYGYSFYLDIVAKDWDALVVDDYVSVFPLPYRKKFGIKYLYQPNFAQQLGLFTTLSLNTNVLEDFLKAIPKEFSFIEINLNKYFSQEISKYTTISRVNIEMDLMKDSTTLEKNYSTNLKRNLKKAQQAELQIANQIRPEDLIQLFRENRGKDLSSYSSEDYANLNRLLYQLLYKNMATIYGLYSNNNTLLASAAFVKTNQRIIFLFSGLKEEGKEISAMPFLIDSVIKKYAGQNLVFDFEGSNDENLARFYLSFGSQKFEYKQLIINNLNPVLKLGFKLYKKFRG
jgi:hypothetical protein